MAQSRAHRVRWLLEELGVDYELVVLGMTREALKNDAYLAKNPLGLVPTLEDGEVVVFESGAIIEYVLETYDVGHRFLPPPGSPERARVRSWLHWAEASATPPVTDYLAHTAVRPEPKRIPAVADDARKRIGRVFDAIERALEGHDHIAGAELSAADMMLGFTLHLCCVLGLLGEDRPAVLAYYERLAERPAFQRALAV